MDKVKIETLKTFDNTIEHLNITRDMIRAMKKHNDVSENFYYEFIKDLLGIEINLRYGKTQVKFYNNYVDTIDILKSANEEIDNLWSLMTLGN